MPNNEGDIKFTFDASSFKTAVKQIVGEMGKVNNNTKDMASKVDKGMGGALSKFALKAVAIIGVLKGAMASVTNGIPEVGMTFKIAGDIFTKNLLWPLRKELIPILQKVLDWVRDNRKNFIIFGSVLVNVFKMIKGIAGAVITAISPVADMIKGLFQSVFGNTAQSFSETINMIMLKIVAFSIMVGDIVRPVFEGVALAIKSLIKLVVGVGSALFSGFIKGFGGKDGVLDIVQTLKNYFTELANVITFITPAIKLLAEVVGIAFGVYFKSALSVLSMFYNLLIAIFKLIQDPKNYANIFKEYGESVKKDAQAIVDTFKSSAPKFQDTWEKFTGKPSTPESETPKPVNDLIITRGGKTFSTSPQDTIIATKTPETLGVNPRGRKTSGSAPITITFGDINVTSTEGNAVNTGRGIVQGVEQQIRNILLDSISVEGAF